MPDQLDPLQQTMLQKAITPVWQAPERGAKQAADALTEPTLTRSPNAARLRGFGAGALQGAGKLISNLTSPLGAGITLASLGLGSAFPAAGAGLGTAAESLAPLAGEVAAPAAELAGVGGEAAYNAARPAAQALADPAVAAYNRLLPTIGKQVIGR